MKPFGSTKECPKCGSADLKRTWECEYPDTCPRTEHLELSCRSCGTDDIAWEETKDAPSPRKGEAMAHKCGQDSRAEESPRRHPELGNDYLNKALIALNEWHWNIAEDSIVMKYDVLQQIRRHIWAAQDAFRGVPPKAGQGQTHEDKETAS